MFALFCGYFPYRVKIGLRARFPATSSPVPFPRSKWRAVEPQLISVSSLHYARYPRFLNFSRVLMKKRLVEAGS